MAINHEKIRSVIKTVGIIIFVVSIVMKLRDIIVHGGKLADEKLNDPSDDEEFDNG